MILVLDLVLSIYQLWNFNANKKEIRDWRGLIVLTLARDNPSLRITAYEGGL